MEEQHKNILRRNRVNLVTGFDPFVIYEPLCEKGVFTKGMIDQIKDAGSQRDQARELVRYLESRGSQAFPLFLETLHEAGYQSLKETLLTGTPPVQLQPIVLPPVVKPPLIFPPLDIDENNKDFRIYSDEGPNKSPSPTLDILNIKPRPRRESLQSYKMDSRPCGYCLIINNTDFEPESELSNRRGSNVDTEKMKKRFKSLNFTVDVKTNLKQGQIKREMLDLSNRDHSAYDCCVVIMLSHGTEVPHRCFAGAVYGVDGKYVTVQSITNYLNGQNCPSLQGKPKLFFIQACGGEGKDFGFEVSGGNFESSYEDYSQTDAIPTSSSSDSLSTPDEVDAKATLPTPSDILVSYSTFPGYVSWRDPKAGSWYIETLDRILEEHATTHDLLSMLTMVNDEVAQNSAKGIYKQMPGSFNFLRKVLYFQTFD